MAQIDLDTLPRTRKEAQELGSKYYFTGKPCKRGHLSHRCIKGKCPQCARLASIAASKAKTVANAKAREEQSHGKTCAECNVTLASHLRKFCSAHCRRKEWARRNPEKVKESSAKHRAQNPAKGSEYSRRWLEANRHVRRAYEKAKYDGDPNFRLRANLRSLVRNSLAKHSTRKATKSTLLIGCSILELRHHLESQFQPGMTWENRSAWHIDHIRPCASFDLSDLEQQKECFHYTNLQPLWAEENIKKGARLVA